MRGHFWGQLDRFLAPLLDGFAYCEELRRARRALAAERPLLGFPLHPKLKPVVRPLMQLGLWRALNPAPWRFLRRLRCGRVVRVGWVVRALPVRRLRRLGRRAGRRAGRWPPPFVVFGLRPRLRLRLWSVTKWGPTLLFLAAFLGIRALLLFVLLLITDY